MIMEWDHEGTIYRYDSASDLIIGPTYVEFNCICNNKHVRLANSRSGEHRFITNDGKLALKIEALLVP